MLPRPTLSGGEASAAAALPVTSRILTFTVGVSALFANDLVVAGPGYEYGNCVGYRRSGRKGAFGRLPARVRGSRQKSFRSVTSSTVMHSTVPKSRGRGGFDVAPEIRLSGNRPVTASSIGG